MRERGERGREVGRGCFPLLSCFRGGKGMMSARREEFGQWKEVRPPSPPHHHTTTTHHPLIIGNWVVNGKRRPKGPSS